MADKVKTKEPVEVMPIEVDFSDKMPDWEDLRSVEISPTKLTGEQIRNYKLDLTDASKLLISKEEKGSPTQIQSLGVNDDVQANLQVFNTLDPVEAPEIYKDGSKLVEQKSVSFTVVGGENMLDYLIQVDGETTEENLYSKEVKIRVRAE